MTSRYSVLENCAESECQPVVTLKARVRRLLFPSLLREAAKIAILGLFSTPSAGGVTVHHMKIPKIGQLTKISDALNGISPNVKSGQIT
jgi:hypothetical protein